MASTCPECGAPLTDGASCRDYFHELLALEAQVPGAAGGLSHFFAVGTYNLQHPATFVPAALFGLRRTLGDVLAGRATLDDARRRARYGSEGPTRVLRRADTAPSDAELAMLRTWPSEWPMTVRDVCRVPPEQYESRVREWAGTVVAALRDVPPYTPHEERAT